MNEGEQGVATPCSLSSIRSVRPVRGPESHTFASTGCVSVAVYMPDYKQALPSIVIFQ
jgi:hypothetical protein